VAKAHLTVAIGVDHARLGRLRPLAGDHGSLADLFKTAR
jgi:hypothetical protein